MKKISIVFLSVFSWYMSNSQEPVCDASVIKNIKGKWITGEDNIVSPDKTFPRTQYKYLNSGIDKIAALFQQAYPQPMGIEAKWYRSIRGSSIVNNGPMPYQFNSLYRGWYCNQNLHKLMLAPETYIWAYVWVNTFGWFMTDQYDKTSLKIESNDTYMLPRKIGEWKGFPVYELADKKNAKLILITRDNQLPFKPVSRLQFLQTMKSHIEAQKKEQIDIVEKQPVRTDAEEEVAKQKALTSYSKLTPGHEASFLKNYKTSRQLKDENLERTEKYFSERLHPIDDPLNNMSKEELQQPAILDQNFVSFFKKFTTEEKGGRMMIFINNDYFNLKLPRYVPQLIVFYWSWDKTTSGLSFNTAIEENFPANKLKEMIDK